MRVLAIDPGFGRCGVAVLEGDSSKPVLLYSSCIETSSTLDFPGRLKAVGNEIVRLLNEYSPQLLVLEELYFSNNQKTALRVAEVRGMIIFIATSQHTPVREFNPSAVKIALTSNGRATKEAVIRMVGLTLPLPERKMLDDEYDAIALGITALAEEKRPRWGAAEDIHNL